MWLLIPDFSLLTSYFFGWFQDLPSSFVILVLWKFAYHFLSTSHTSCSQESRPAWIASKSSSLAKIVSRVANGCMVVDVSKTLALAICIRSRGPERSSSMVVIFKANQDCTVRAIFDFPSQHHVSQHHASQRHARCHPERAWIRLSSGLPWWQLGCFNCGGLVLMSTLCNAFTLHSSWGFRA